MSRYEITIENYQGSVEKHYFEILDLLGHGNWKAIKVKDTFNSSITSSFWGSIEQRRTLQQEKASQFLGVIGQMVKSMFQIIRSLRIMDERLGYYHEAKHGPDKKSAEIALKGIWIDLVEGGGKNPSSVYGLATQVGFTTLPDLFFDICPRDSKDLKKKLAELKESGLNRKLVEDVLSRKLFQYMQWRDATEKEITSSRKFHLAYLRQHFNTIRMYLDWIRPYLKNINRLSQHPSRSEDILEMSDTATADIEVFAYSGEDKFIKYLPTIKISFEYRTVPELVYHQEYQKGPIHLGRTKIVLKGEPMTLNEIREIFRKDYLKDIKLLEDLFASMSALGEDLVKYLEEAHEEDPAGKLGIKLEKGEIKPPKGIVAMFGPFKDIGKGFSTLFGSFRSKKKDKDFKKALITYDMPPQIEKIWKRKMDKISKMKGRHRKRFKIREDFDTEEEFEKYLKQEKTNNTNEEENEFNAIRDSLNKGKNRVWTIYDNFKKMVGGVRW